MERRIHGNTFEDLRNDIKHREAVHRTALSLTEYIVKMGDEKWADHIVASVGPWLMIQLTDMANMFESIRKFVLSIISSLRSVAHAVTDTLRASMNGGFPTEL